MGDTMDWYNELKRASIAKHNVTKLFDIDQHILVTKMNSDVFEELNPEECYTFRHKDKFGFSEGLVNQLMQLAYNEGRRGIDGRSFETGREEAKAEIRKKMEGLLECLDIEVCTGPCGDY